MMKLDDIRKALDELAAMVKAEILARLRSPIGINRSAGKNTLEGSNLEKSIDVYTNEESDGLVFVIADYFSFVTGGRKHGMNPPPSGTFNSILTWVRRKNVTLGNITDENVVAYIVYRNLRDRVDLPPRPFIGVDYDYSKDAGEVIPFLDKMVDDWFDELFDKIMEETDNYFNK